MGHFACSSSKCKAWVVVARKAMAEKLVGYFGALAECARVAEFVDANDDILLNANAKADAMFSGRAALNRLRVLDFSCPPFASLTQPASLGAAFKIVNELKTPIRTIRVPADRAIGIQIQTNQYSLSTLQPHSIISDTYSMWIYANHMQHVRHLQLIGNFNANLFGCLAPQLRTLIITSFPYQLYAHSFANLRHSPLLTTLQLTGTFLDDDGLKAFKECKALTSIDISSNHTLQGIGLLALAALPSVTRLVLTGLRYPPAASKLDVLGWKSCLERLAPKLKHLDLNSTRVREEDMTNIWPLFDRIVTLKLTGTLCDLGHALPKEPAAAVENHNIAVLQSELAVSEVSAASLFLSQFSPFRLSPRRR